MRVVGSEFTIGKYRFRGCIECEIQKSILEYQDKGIIKIPTSAVLKKDGVRTNSVQTSRTFKVGDAVTIKLGYDGNLKEEFIGFVSRVNLKSPCEIELEGYSYQLRTKKNIVASWKNTSVKEILQKITEGTDITLHPDIPDIPLNNIKIDNASGIQVIDYIKQLLKDVLTVYFLGKELYAGLSYMDLTKKTVKHRLGWNTINSDNLKQHLAEEVDVKVTFEFKKASGESVKADAGIGGAVVKKETVTAVSDPKVLQEMANTKQKREQYDGMEGDFTTFLIPFTQPGDVSDLSSTSYPEMNGKYFIESVKVNYGQGGGRRSNQIKTKLL